MPRGTRKKSAASLPGLSAPTAPAVKPIEKFHNALALSRWAPGIIRGYSLDSLRGLLNRREMEGIDAETGHTIFFRDLETRLGRIEGTCPKSWER